MTRRAALPIRVVVVADDSDGSVVTMPERREQLHLPLSARSVATAISCPRPEQQSPVRSSRRAMLTALREIMAQWRRRVLMRNELMTLGDRDLRDIGWTRAELEAEFRKPFWRA